MTVPSTATNSSMLNHEIFRELDDELEIEAKPYPYLRNFYFNFDQQRQENPSQRNPNGNDRLQKEDFYNDPFYIVTTKSPLILTFLLELRCHLCDINYVDLEELVILMHKMSIIHLHEDLWHCILKVGTGQLNRTLERDQQKFALTITDLNNLGFWSPILISILQSKDMIVHTVTYNQNEQVDNDRIYIQFIENYLKQLQEHTRQCKTQFDISIARTLPTLPHHLLKYKIEDFLQHSATLNVLRGYFRQYIILLESILADRFYQLAYLKHQPTDYQQQYNNTQCSLTYGKTKQQQEKLLIEYASPWSKFPQELEFFNYSIPRAITNISEPNIRKRFTYKYERILQQAWFDAFKMIRTAIDIKICEYEYLLKTTTNEFWKNQPRNERINSIKLDIVDQRKKNIINSIKSIYELKMKFRHVETEMIT